MVKGLSVYAPLEALYARNPAPHVSALSLRLRCEEELMHQKEAVAGLKVSLQCCPWVCYLQRTGTCRVQAWYKIDHS